MSIEFSDAIYVFDSRFWNGVFPPEGQKYQVFFGKCSQGTWVIPQFQVQQRSAIQLNLGRSAWLFWRASNPVISAANTYHKAMQSIGYGQFPPIIDLEDTRAPRTQASFDSAWAQVQEVEQLSGQEAIIYSAAWYWNYWLKKFSKPEHPIYTRKLWEADPPPDTPEPGYFDKSDLMIRQTRLDFNPGGFNADIDESEMRREFWEKYMGDSPPDEKLSSVKISYNPKEVEIFLTEI